MPSQNPKQWAYALPAALALLAPFNILASLAMDIYLPVVPAMPYVLGTTATVIQLTLSFYMVVLGLGQMVFGPLSDRIGRRPVLIMGTVLFAVASLAMATVSTALPFVLLRVVQAMGASAMLVALFATVRDVYGERPESVAVYGLLNATLAFVPALGPIVGALVAQMLGWRAVFAALGLPALIMLTFALPAWHETRPERHSEASRSIYPILRSGTFWTYMLGFAAAMGAFFVFFSTAPRVLINQAGFSQVGFSVAFATAAAVMIATARLAKLFAERWGIAGTLARAMGLLLAGAALLAIGEMLLAPSFVSFVVPMWVISVGIAMASSVTANGALAKFDDVAGTAVALYFCVQSILVGAIGSFAVVLLDGETAWPLAGYSTGMALVTLAALDRLRRGNPDPLHD